MNRHHKIHGEHANDKYIIGGVIIFLIMVGLVSVWLLSSGQKIDSTKNSDKATTTSTSSVSTLNANKVVSLAQCLAQKKITMYGAEWCGHCQDQKAAFGEAWSLVPYVECPDNVKLCLAKKVKGYPSWVKEDGTILEGFVALDKLAVWAECQI